VKHEDIFKSIPSRANFQKIKLEEVVRGSAVDGGSIRVRNALAARSGNAVDAFIDEVGYIFGDS